MQKPKKKPLVVKDPASGSDGKSDASGTGGRLPPGADGRVCCPPGHIFADIGGEDMVKRTRFLGIR